jgi:hypothetical protein
MNDLSDLKARGVESLFGWHYPSLIKPCMRAGLLRLRAGRLPLILTYLRFLEPELVSQLSLPDMSPGYHCQSSVDRAYSRAK